MSYRNVTGLAPSVKALGPAGFESTLERDFLILLDFSPEVEEFEVQPVELSWRDTSGPTRVYTPDVLVTYAPESGRRPMLVEVKYVEELRTKWSELQPKFVAAADYARSQGWIFRIVTERQIRTPMLKNATFLLPYIQRGPDKSDYMNALDETLARMGEASVDSILKAIFVDEWNRAALIPTLWYLIGTFQIGFDFSKPLTMSSALWKVREEEWSKSELERYNWIVRRRPPGQGDSQ